MAAPTTVRTGASVADHLASLAKEQQRRDARSLVELMARATGCPAEMWGSSLVGFDAYTYTYASGRSGEWPVVSFAARASSMAVYLMDGFAAYDDLLERLGPHTKGKSCLHVKRLEAVDTSVLEELVTQSAAHVRAAHG